MSTAAQPNSRGAEPRVTAVEVTDQLIVAHLVDGRTISVPLAWSWRLLDATPEQRSRYEIFGDGAATRRDAVRIISARQATRNERSNYEEGHP